MPVSGGAGLPLSLWPAYCFHGVSDEQFEVGHALCAALFDGDSEVTTGLASANCHIGLDFGPDAEVRVEQLCFHPFYDVLDTEDYINSQFQVGVLKANACEETVYGWRGSGYRGCQDITKTGAPCQAWTVADASKGLGSHRYCRNPEPASRGSIWCYTQGGVKQDCHPKVPDIKWTTVYTLTGPPKMLWNMAMLAKPQIGRFVRYLSQAGNCLFTEIEVLGYLQAPAESCDVVVRNARTFGGIGSSRYQLNRSIWQGAGATLSMFPEPSSDWARNATAKVRFSDAGTPVVTKLDPSNGTARRGIMVKIHGTGFSTNVSELVVVFNDDPCNVTNSTATEITCITSRQNKGIQPSNVYVFIASKGKALVMPQVNWRYLDAWSSLDTWNDRPGRVRVGRPQRPGAHGNVHLGQGRYIRDRHRVQALHASSDRDAHGLQV